MQRSHNSLLIPLWEIEMKVLADIFHQNLSDFLGGKSVLYLTLPTHPQHLAEGFTESWSEEAWWIGTCKGLGTVPVSGVEWRIVQVDAGTNY